MSFSCVSVSMFGSITHVALAILVPEYHASLVQYEMWREWQGVNNWCSVMTTGVGRFEYFISARCTGRQKVMFAHKTSRWCSKSTYVFQLRPVNAKDAGSCTVYNSASVSVKQNTASLQVHPKPSAQPCKMSFLGQQRPCTGRGLFS